MSTILTVDDNDVNRMVVSRVLRQAGFTVQEARDGEEGLRQARKGGASLVLLDIHLPDIDGLEVCRRLKEDPVTASLPVVHLTAACPESAQWAAALERGADGYLVHPVDPLVLVATVRAFLRWKTAEETLRREMSQREKVEQTLRESELRWRALGGELEARVEARTRELAASEERHRSVVEVLHEGVLVLDAEGCAVAFNASAERIFGVSAAAVLGHSVLEPTWRLVAEDGTPIPPEESPGWVALTTGRSFPDMVIGFEKPDATAGWLLQSVKPLPAAEGGRPGGVVISFTDLTDRRRVRQREDAQHEVTRIVSQAASFAHAAPELLRAIGEVLEMEAGEIWCVAPHGSVLQRAWEWHQPRLDRADFVRDGTDLILAPGEDLPGRVWKLGHTQWEADVASAQGISRREPALRAGLRGGLAFPVRTADGVPAVFAFFGRWVLPADDDMLLALDALGTQVGDFVDRRAAEKALRDGEARLRAMFAQTPVPIHMAGPDTRFTSANQAFCAMLGYTEQELYARTVLDVTHPEDLAATAMAARSHLEGGVPFMVREKRYLAKDGRVVWVRVTTSLVRDESGQPSYFVGIVENITARRRAEALATAQGALLEMVARGAPLSAILAAIVDLLEGQSEGMIGSVLTLDEDGRHLRHAAAPHLPEAYTRAIDGLRIGPNAGSCGTAAFTGQPVIVADVTTDPRWEAYRELVAPHAFRACWSMPILSRAGRVLGTLALYCRNPRAPGDHEWRLIEGAAHVASIALERARADEALRSSEERYRTLFENSKDAIFIVGRERGFVDVNQAALDLFGVTREELAGLDARQTFASEVELQWFLKQMKAVGSVRDFEAVLRRKDRSQMDCLITASVRRDSSGRVVAHEGTIRDVTAQKAANWANRELSRHLLQVQDEERRRIARELHDSTAQHLAALGMHLAVLGGSAGILGPRGARAVGECHSLVQKCSKEVRTLSYLLHPPLLDEAGLSAALRWLGEGFSARSGIAVALEITPEMGRLPRDAELALFRIVQEALTNVHRHSHSPTAVIRLGPGREGVVLEVEDEGRGMPGAGPQGTPRSLTGLGVGILGMRERVRQLGGELEVISDGAGTTVRATLPLGLRA